MKAQNKIDEENFYINFCSTYVDFGLGIKTRSDVVNHDIMHYFQNLLK